MYDILARGYDALYGEEQEKKLFKIKHVLTGRILDIGAGTGIIARHFPHVVSLDPCWEMLKRAPEMKVLGTAEHLPFQQGYFTTIVSLTALHHTTIEKVVQELKRLQAPCMALTVLKKSKHAKKIFVMLKKNFGMHIIEDDKDYLLVKETKK